MELEQQITSLELSRQLKAAGVPQDSYCYWYSLQHYQGEQEPADELFVSHETPAETHQEYSAFTVAELGEMLPHKLERSDEPYCYDLVQWPSPCATNVWMAYLWQ